MKPVNARHSGRVFSVGLLLGVGFGDPVRANVGDPVCGTRQRF
jgi:hypothetical protein